MKFDPNRLILGCANMGGLFLDGVKPDLTRAKAILSEGIKMGITSVETAPMYGWGSGEYFLGRAIEELGLDRKKIQIATKSLRSLYPCTDFRDTSEPDFWTLGEPNCQFTHKWRPDFDSVLQTTQRSLEVLRTSYLDALSYHDIGNYMTDEPGASWEKLDQAVKAISLLKKTGFVRSIGFGGKECETLNVLIQRHPGHLDYAATTNYNLLDQEFLKLKMFEVCKRNKIEYRVAGPFASRLLAEDPRKATFCIGKDGVSRWYYAANLDRPVTFNYRYIKEDRYKQACTLWNIVQEFGEEAPRAAAMQFLLAHPQVRYVIIGASTIEHLQAAKRDIEKPINPRLWDALRKEEILDKNAPVPS